MSSTAAKPPIVLIHGMWMTPLSWEHWVSHYTDRGHRVLAPAWPGLDAEPEQLRRDPTPLRGIGITDVVDHYDRIIRGLDQPPIIIGHSFGGLYTQLLLDRGLGAAGVALALTGPGRFSVDAVVGLTSTLALALIAIAIGIVGAVANLALRRNPAPATA